MRVVEMTWRLRGGGRWRYREGGCRVGGVAGGMRAVGRGDKWEEAGGWWRWLRR